MRTKLSVILSGAALFLVVAVVPALAHHAFAAEFDSKKPVKLRGTVTKMEWINPHAWIHIDVKKQDGTVDEWMIEAGTPNTLLRRGFTRDSLKPGTEVLVDGCGEDDFLSHDLARGKRNDDIRWGAAIAVGRQRRDRRPACGGDVVCISR